MNKINECIELCLLAFKMLTLRHVIQVSTDVLLFYYTSKNILEKHFVIGTL